jgi:alkaline phosphatase D
MKISRRSFLKTAAAIGASLAWVGPARGHGYAKVRLSADEMRTEFVCIPRPIARSERPDGGPIRYRVVHTAALWKSGGRPQLKTSVLEGDAGLSI